MKTVGEKVENFQHPSFLGNKATMLLKNYKEGDQKGNMESKHSLVLMQKVYAVAKVEELRIYLSTGQDALEREKEKYNALWNN